MNLLITIAKASELLLAGGLPNVKFDGAAAGEEGQGVNLDTKSSYIFLLKLATQVTLDKGSLAYTTITNKNELEFGNCCSLTKLKREDKKYEYSENMKVRSGP